MADRLASRGAVVVRLDTPRYLAMAVPGGDRCAYPAADLEALMHHVEGALALPHYFVPWLIGRGDGAALAYAALAEAPSGTFAGAGAIGFCPTLTVKKYICHGSALRFSVLAQKGQGQTIHLEPAPEVEAPVVFDAPGAGCRAGDVQALAARLHDAALLPAIPPGPGGSLERLLALYSTLLDHRQRARQAAGLAAPSALPDLPLLELPAAGPASDLLAVVISGDGGFLGLDAKLARDLAAHGAAVVGLDSLQYFWRPRDPDGAASDLARILDHYLKAWGKRRVLLVGYSQGADVIPFLLNRLPPALRGKIRLAALLGPDANATWDMGLDSFVSGRAQHPDLPVLPEIARLARTGSSPILCVYGSDETGSICEQTDRRTVTLLPSPGGHGFRKIRDQLAQRLIAAADGKGAAAAGRRP